VKTKIDTRARALSVVGAFAMLLASGLASAAGNNPNGKTAKESCAPGEGATESWIDRAHSYVTGQVCRPTEWFDGFFGDERMQEENLASTYVRLKVGVRWREHDGWDMPVDTYASVKLPKASDRLRLIVFGQSDDDVIDDPSDPRYLSEGEDKAQVGLRYEVMSRPRSSLSFTGTTSPKVEARYRYEYPVSDITLARFTQTAFWSDNDGWGGRTRGDLEHRISPSSLARLSLWGKYCDECDDLEWRTEAILLQRISPKAAQEYKALAYGDTASGHVEDYRLQYKYRRNFHRPWLFWELRPELRWPWRADDDREMEPRVTLSLEVQFAGGPGYTYK